MDLYKFLRAKTSKRLPRRIHCYCIGAAKTATTSVSAMFEHHYDARHELDIENTNRMIIRYLENQLSEEEMLVFLKHRDNNLELELESTHSLVYVAKELIQLFPDAKFIITVREPMAWLRSRLNFHFKKHPGEWEEYRQYFWMDKIDSYQPEERILQEHNLAPLHVYLEQYAQHYDLAFSHIPDAQRLVLRTDEISNSCRKIAEFLHIRSTRLSPERTNTEPGKAAFIDQLDEQFVRKTIWAHTAPLIKQFFPEALPLYQTVHAK